ncbi:MAG TPA: NAD-dependent epimerase/dehydratase family protein [Halioglobus sp.]
MIAKGSLIAVTGATGFIGTCLCQSLLERGYQVRALVRNPAKAGHLASRGVALIQGDLNNPTALERLVTVSGAVIHCAGAVRGNSQEAFDQVNVAGTAALLTAMQALAQPPPLLLLSSIVAREPQLSWYARSKREGEKLLGQSATLNWVILRPPAVYGPGDKEMLPIFQWMRRGIALVPGSPEARISLIHVSDLVDAIVACLQNEGANRQTLTLCDRKHNGYNWRELASVAAEYWSRKVRLWRIPPHLLDAVAALNSRAAGITGTAPMLTPPKLRELRHTDWVADNDAITAATGWTPRLELREGLQTLEISAH